MLRSAATTVPPKDFLKKLPPLSPEDEKRKNQLMLKIKQVMNQCEHWTRLMLIDNNLQIVEAKEVVLFMKGTAPIPECKYSQAIVNVVAFYSMLMKLLIYKCARSEEIPYNKCED